MWGDGTNRVLVSIEIRAQSKSSTVYYVCREQNYKADLFVAMQHISRRHEVIQSMSAKRVDNELFYVSEIKP